MTPLPKPAARRSAPACVRANPWDAGCPSRQILSLIADKWVLLVLPLLTQGPLRNGDLLRRVEGISQKMLTQTLRDLEQHGLVGRVDHGEVPPRVDYHLTALGASLAETLGTLDQWVVEHFPAVTAARAQYQRPKTPSPLREVPTRRA